MSSLVYYSDYQIVTNLWNQKKEDKSFDLSSMVELLLDFTNDFIHWFKRIKSFKF